MSGHPSRPFASARRAISADDPKCLQKLPTLAQCHALCRTVYSTVSRLGTPLPAPSESPKRYRNGVCASIRREQLSTTYDLTVVEVVIILHDAAV